MCESELDLMMEASVIALVSALATICARIQTCKTFCEIILNVKVRCWKMSTQKSKYTAKVKKKFQHEHELKHLKVKSLNNTVTCIEVHKTSDFRIGTNSHYMTSCFLACLLLSCWLFISIYKAHILHPSSKYTTPPVKMIDDRWAGLPV